MISKLLTLSFAALLAVAASAQTLSGIVTNRTNDKPAASDDVVLLKLAQGMQELATAKTDARGNFTIKVPAEEAGTIHLLRVTHDKANYFAPVPVGTSKVDVDVYTAKAEVTGVQVSEDVMQLQTAPDGNTLRVVQHFLLQNTSQPATTLFNEHPFELYLPAGATVEGASAKAPGGMGVEQPLLPMGDPNHYAIVFPIRPGETEFNVWYRIPYKDSFTFAPRLTLPTDALGIMLPKGMNFKQGAGTEFTSVSAQIGGKAQAYIARNVKPSQPLGFTVSGKGELPRDIAAQSSSAQSGSADAAATASADPNTDTRPGGGLGTPLDKDAERDPWTKYRWWIIGGLGLAMAIAAGVMMRTPATPAFGNAPNTPGNALQVLRDEMFAVETDRLEGRVSEREYVELKSAYDLILKRALARNGMRTESTPG